MRFFSRFCPFGSHESANIHVYTKKKPSKRNIEDISYGYTVSAHLKDLEAGPTVIVKRKTIMAAQGAEKIWETVKRGCILGKKDAVAIIGYEKEDVTEELLQTLKEYKGKILALENNAVNIKDINSFVRFADRLGLIFLAFEGDKFYNAKLFDE